MNIKTLLTHNEKWVRDIAKYLVHSPYGIKHLQDFAFGINLINMRSSQEFEIAMIIGDIWVIGTPSIRQSIIETPDILEVIECLKKYE